MYTVEKWLSWMTIITAFVGGFFILPFIARVLLPDNWLWEWWGSGVAVLFGICFWACISAIPTSFKMLDGYRAKEKKADAEKNPYPPSSDDPADIATVDMSNYRDRDFDDCPGSPDLHHDYELNPQGLKVCTYCGHCPAV